MGLSCSSVWDPRLGTSPPSLLRSLSWLLCFLFLCFFFTGCWLIKRNCSGIWNKEYYHNNILLLLLACQQAYFIAVVFSLQHTDIQPGMQYLHWTDWRMQYEKLIKEAELQFQKCLCEFKSLNYAALLKAINRHFEMKAIFMAAWVRQLTLEVNNLWKFKLLLSPVATVMLKGFSFHLELHVHSYIHRSVLFLNFSRKCQSMNNIT